MTQTAAGATKIEDSDAFHKLAMAMRHASGPNPQDAYRAMTAFINNALAQEREQALADQMALMKKCCETDQAEFNRKWTEQKDRADAAEASLARLAEALTVAEAALADIGDADRDPGDDLAWCEARAAKALPAVRALLPEKAEVAQPEMSSSERLKQLRPDIFQIVEENGFGLYPDATPAPAMGEELPLEQIACMGFDAFRILQGQSPKTYTAQQIAQALVASEELPPLPAHPDDCRDWTMAELASIEHYGRACTALRQSGAATVGELCHTKTWQHAANEWADTAYNGLQWLRHIEDTLKAGRSVNLESARKNMEQCCRDAKRVADSVPRTPAAPVSQPAAQEVRFFRQKGSAIWIEADNPLNWLMNPEFAEVFETRTLYTAPLPLSTPVASSSALKAAPKGWRAAIDDLMDFAPYKNAQPEGMTRGGPYVRKDAVIAALASAQAGSEAALYTCIGKGGEYELIGTAKGAGTSRELDDMQVYRAGDQLYFRTTEDFKVRMQRIETIQPKGVA